MHSASWAADLSCGGGRAASDERGRSGRVAHHRRRRQIRACLDRRPPRLAASGGWRFYRFAAHVLGPTQVIEVHAEVDDDALDAAVVRLLEDVGDALRGVGVLDVVAAVDATGVRSGDAPRDGAEDGRADA